MNSRREHSGWNVKLWPGLTLVALIVILQAEGNVSDGRRCHWCGPLAEQVHRSERAQPCRHPPPAAVACEPGLSYCAIVATSHPYVESRLCTKLYQDECYPQYCNTTNTWKMTCPCRGDLCNGANTQRETEAFNTLLKLAAKTSRSKKIKRSYNNATPHRPRARHIVSSARVLESYDEVPGNALDNTDHVEYNEHFGIGAFSNTAFGNENYVLGTMSTNFEDASITTSINDVNENKINIENDLDDMTDSTTNSDTDEITHISRNEHKSLNIPKTNEPIESFEIEHHELTTPGKNENFESEFQEEHHDWEKRTGMYTDKHTNYQTETTEAIRVNEKNGKDISTNPEINTFSKDSESYEKNGKNISSNPEINTSSKDSESHEKIGKDITNPEMNTFNKGSEFNGNNFSHLHVPFYNKSEMDSKTDLEFKLEELNNNLPTAEALEQNKSSTPNEPPIKPTEILPLVTGSVKTARPTEPTTKSKRGNRADKTAFSIIFILVNSIVIFVV